MYIANISKMGTIIYFLVVAAIFLLNLNYTIDALLRYLEILFLNIFTLLTLTQSVENVNLFSCVKLSIFLYQIYTDLSPMLFMSYSPATFFK